MTIREQLQAWQPAQRNNPLPAPFEQQAFKVFALGRDGASWADPLFKAERDAKEGKIPVVFHKRNDHEWIVVLSAEKFIEILRESSLVK